MPEVLTIGHHHHTVFLYQVVAQLNPGAVDYFAVILYGSLQVQQCLSVSVRHQSKR